MLTCPTRLLDDLMVLSLGYALTVSRNFEWFIAHNFKLPPGYNYSSTDVLVEIPGDYPCSPPGVGKHVYLSPTLRLRGAKLKDLHEGTSPGWGDWAWFCYQSIQWNPIRDNLVKFMEMVRADLTNPRT